MSLGQLVVRLGLDAADFISGLNRSEKDAARFARSLEKDLIKSAKAVGVSIGSIAGSAGAALIAIDQLAKAAADFKDLEEKTGANAEALASFAVAAGTAGASMEEIAKASILLTKNLTGVDDESKAAGAALTALGIPIKEFKELDPAAQIETVSKALAGFADGAGKTAVATALFGKAGADLLPFLKELENQGGRTVILTQKQIEQADQYADEQARVTAEIRLYAQALVINAFPAVTALTKATQDFVLELIGVSKESGKLAADTGIQNFAEGAVRALGFLVDAADGVIRTFQIVGITIAAGVAQLDALASKNFNGVVAIGKQYAQEVDAILNRTLFSSRVDQRINEIKRNAALSAQEDRGFTPPGRRLNFGGAVRGGAGGRGGAEAQSEAQRLLESLTKQLERTEELTVAQQVLRDIELGRIKGITPALQENILNIARQIDAYNELKKSIEEGAKAFEAEKRAIEEGERVRLRNIDSLQREAEAIFDANRDLRDEIAIIKGGEEARKAIEKARISSAIAIKEEALAQAQLNPLMEAEARLIQSQITALRERQQLVEERSFAIQLAQDAAALQDFKNLFADTFADAFASFIDGSKSASEAFKDFERSIVQSISRIAAQKIGDALFGGNTSGGFDFGKIIGSLFGGGGGFDLGSIFGGFFASGGNPPVGVPSIVGERGPEVFVPKSAGTIIPNSKMVGAVNIYQTVQPGANTQTARQAARMAGDAVRHVTARG